MLKDVNFLAIVSLASLCHAAHGEDFLFTCNTARGSMMAGNRPPEECKGRDVNVIDSAGKVVLIARDPISASDRAARDAEDERIRRAEWEERQRCRRYPDALQCLPKTPPGHRDPAVGEPVN